MANSYWEPYDWYWRKKPCPKGGTRQCHWNSLFKEPRGYCWDCVKLAREQFRRAFEEERLAVERCFAPPLGGYDDGEVQ